MKVATTNKRPTFKRLSLPAAVMITNINAMPAIESNGIALSSHANFP